MEDNAPNPKVIRTAAILMGAVFSSLGLLVLASVAGFMPGRSTAAPSNIVFGYFAAVIFTAAGFAMIFFGLRWTAAAAKLGLLSLICFVLAFNWIAFGPGDRNFTRKSNTSFGSSPRSAVSQTEGRTVFGIFAVLMDGVVIFVLLKSRKKKT
jgi:hypothetical protein